MILVLILFSCQYGAHSASDVSSFAEHSNQLDPEQYAEDWLANWTGAKRGKNHYGHGFDGESLYVHWGDSPTAPKQYANISDCSFFVAATLKRGLAVTDSQLNEWLCPDGCQIGRPQARHFFDAIVQGRRFTKVKQVSSIQRGDLAAINYLDSNTNTGHVLWMASSPNLECSSCSPQSWLVNVIDSSSAVHGHSDTRLSNVSCSGNDQCDELSGASCSLQTNKCVWTGIGRGVLRLFSTPDDRLIGYAWSDLASSERFMNADSPRRRNIVIGRLGNELRADPTMFYRREKK